MRNILLLAFFSCLSLTSCGQGSRNISFFKGTEAYGLAKAAEKEDLNKIERIVKENPKLLEVTNPTSGSNVLTLCLYIEKFESFKKLLELGANPNFINLYSKESVLIEACKPFGSQFEWRKDNRYVELLLKHRADPDYAVEEEFTDQKGHHHMATSPLIKASSLNLELVKLLIKNGADPYKKIGIKKISPFKEALESSKFDIINYFIDTLKVDVFAPLYIREKDSLFIQDLAVNKLTLAKLRGENVEIGEANKERWEFIKKLQGIGVDFKNYAYKL